MNNFCDMRTATRVQLKLPTGHSMPKGGVRIHGTRKVRRTMQQRTQTESTTRSHLNQFWCRFRVGILLKQLGNHSRDLDDLGISSGRLRGVVAPPRRVLGDMIVTTACAGGDSECKRETSGLPTRLLSAFSPVWGGRVVASVALGVALALFPVSAGLAEAETQWQASDVGAQTRPHPPRAYAGAVEQQGSVRDTFVGAAGEAGLPGEAGVDGVGSAGASTGSKANALSPAGGKDDDEARLTASVDSEGVLTALQQDAYKIFMQNAAWVVAGPVVGLLIGSFISGKVAEERREGATRYGLRSAAASMDSGSFQEVLQTLGLPPWAALRDIERPGWANQVIKTLWPYLDTATSDAIRVNVDPILEEYRPAVLSSIKFDKFTFGDVPATVEGVKVYDTGNEGSVEADIFVVWAGNPDVVLGVRAAGDSVRVPVRVTELQVSGCVRLIFKPLLSYFPLFGAIEISLATRPKLDFDLRVVGNDITLVPGVAAPLRSLIKNILASFMVWPRRIVVPIAGESLKLPIRIEEGFPNAVPGKLHLRTVGLRGLVSGGSKDQECWGMIGLKPQGGNDDDTKLAGLPDEAFGPNCVSMLLSGEREGKAKGKEYTFTVEEWRSTTLWAAVCTSPEEGTFMEEIRVSSDWSTQPASWMLCEVDLVDILPENNPSINPDEGNEWVTVVMDLKEVPKAGGKGQEGLRAAVWGGIVNSGSALANAGTSTWRMVQDVPSVVLNFGGKLPSLVAGIRLPSWGTDKISEEQAASVDRTADADSRKEAGAQSVGSMDFAASEDSAEGVESSSRRRRAEEEATAAAVAAAEAAMAAAEKVASVATRPQLRLEIRFKPDKKSFDPDVFSSSYYSPRDHFGQSPESSRNGRSTQTPAKPSVVVIQSSVPLVPLVPAPAVPLLPHAPPPPVVEVSPVTDTATAAAIQRNHASGHAGDPRPGVHATPSTYKPSTPLPAGGVNPPNTKQDGSTDSIDDSRATTGRSATARTSNVDSGARQRTELAAAAKLAAADYHTPPAGKPLSGGLMSMEGPGHALRPATVISARGVLGETSPEIKGESGGRAVASPAEEEGEEMDESRVYPSSTSGTAPATTQTSPPRETEEREELRANYKRRVELLRAAMLEASSDIEGADADQLALLEETLQRAKALLDLTVKDMQERLDRMR